MEAGDVLADDMRVGRPEFCPRAVVGKAGRGDVVRQRVDPDIHHVFRIVGDGDAPVEGGAADREIGEPALHEGDDFVAISFGRDEVRMGFVVRQQLVGVSGEPEEVALLLDPFDGRAARREFFPSGPSVSSLSTKYASSRTEYQPEYFDR